MLCLHTFVYNNNYSISANIFANLQEGWPVEFSLALDSHLTIEDLNGNKNKEVLVSMMNGLTYALQSDGTTMKYWVCSVTPARTT